MPNKPATEAKLIQEVKSIRDQIASLRFEEMHRLKGLMHELARNIYFLIEIATDDQSHPVIDVESKKKVYEIAWYALAHTVSKEGEMLVDQYRDLRKKRVTLKARREFDEAFEDLYDHIYRDTLSIAQ